MFDFFSRKKEPASASNNPPRKEYVVAQKDDLQDGQMKEVSVGETGKKILLTRVHGKYHATSHLCTHFKAPLIKGSLTSDGTIICPWHGACFSAVTGDIEESPALNSLVKHEIKEGENGQVILVAAEEDLQSSSRTPNLICKLDDDAGINSNRTVIAGGGGAGLIAAETLRKEGYKGKIVLVTAEDHLPIDRTKLSKGFSGDVSKLFLRDAEFFKQGQIEVMCGVKVTSVDTAKCCVALSSGSSLGYKNLILATGSEARRLSVEGSDLGNIFAMRTAKDSSSILESIEKNGKKPKIVVIGTSFIGMEAASFLVGQAESMTVIGIEKVPFQRVLGESVGLALQRLHESNGVKIKISSSVARFEPSPNDPGRVGGVVLESGEVISADIVILGVGVRPLTDFLQGCSGVTLEKDGSVLVNDRMQLQNFPNIYAVGDIARFPLDMLDGHVTRIEHWCVAQQQGRVAAKNICGNLTRYDFIPFFWTSMFGKSIRYCGHALDYDRVIIQGGNLATLPADSLSFVAFYVKGEKILAVASLARDPVVAHAALLFKAKKMLKVSDLVDEKGEVVTDILSIKADQ